MKRDTTPTQDTAPKPDAAQRPAPPADVADNDMVKQDAAKPDAVKPDAASRSTSTRKQPPSDAPELTDADRERARQVAKSTATMSMATLASRATGFIRTWAMAFALGSTALSAGFSLANNLPNMIYELVAGGVLSTAFLPIYLQQRNRRGRDAANLYAANLTNITVLLLGIIALLASIFAPQVMVTQSLFSSASDETVEQAVWFFRFFAFQVVFYGASAVFGGLLNAERRYFWPAVSSIFMNIVSILSFFSYPFISAVDPALARTCLAVGTLLSIVVMACVQIPALVKAGFRFKLYIDFNGEGFRETLRLALPAIACTAINLVSLSFMNSCALHVSDTGPASVSYAWMWYQFPYGVLSVALSTALFTEMSECTTRGDSHGFKKHLNLGLRTTWLLIIPMAALLFACAPELIGLYAAGKFSADDIGPVADLLRGWAVALPLYAGYMFLYRAFSAMKDLKTLALCNLVLTFLQVGIYMVATGVIDVGVNLGLVGLPVGDTVFYGLMIVVLLLVLRRRVGPFHFGRLARSTAKVSLASLVGGGITFALGAWARGFFDVSGMLSSFVLLVVLGVVGLALVFALCSLLRVNEIVNLVMRVKEKLRPASR